jgi:HlyD family secretion protein
MSRNLKYLFTIAVPVAGLIAASQWMPAFNKKSGAQFTYETVAASRGSIAKLVSTSGPVRALVTVSIGSQLSGQIQELKADFNTEVKPNDVLAVIDDKTFVAKVAQARADLAAARATLTNQTAALAKAEAVSKQAERTVGRQQTLVQKGISSTAALDTATRDIEVAKAEISVAKAQIENAKATVAQREAQLLQAEIDLDRTRIRSPINGTVISRTIDIGQTVAASLQAPELFKIAQDIRRIRIEAQVNEADVGAVTEGNGVSFTVDAYPERKFAGKVTQVRLAATEVQNIVTYTVIIEADNPDRRLFPGMTANVQIETAKRDDTLRVPNDALRFKPRGEVAAARQSGGAGGGGAGGGERRERMMEQLKDELQLTDEQVKTVREEMAKFFQEARARSQQAQGQGQGTPQPAAGFGAAPRPQNDMTGQRNRMTQRLEQILAPMLTDAQKPLFDRWKRGRENTRSGSVFVLAANGEPESRSVRLGIADEQFTEVIGGALKEDEKVVIRAKETKK